MLLHQSCGLKSSFCDVTNKKMREHELTNHRPSLTIACSLFLNLNLNLILCKGTVSGYSVNRWPSTFVKFTQQDGRKKSDGKTLVCDKRDRVITCVFCRGLHITPMFSGPLQKNLFKGNWSLAKSCFKQNYCQARHPRFAVFFPVCRLLSSPVPSCCVGFTSLKNVQLVLHIAAMTSLKR